MRKINKPNMVGIPQQTQNVFDLIFRASQDADIVDLAQAFTISGTFTPTTTLNVTSPTAANIAAVLATFLLYCQSGGPNRTT